MSKDVQLVNPEELKNLIQKLDLPDEKKEYLEARWLNYVLWWDSRATINKANYLLFRRIVMIGGALIPVMVGLREVRAFEGYGILFTLATVVFSLMVAIGAGMEEIYHYGDIWRDKRSAAEFLKIEGFRYFQLTGAYKGKTHKSAYADFTDAVENLIEREIKDYIVAVKPKAEKDEPEPKPAPPTSPDNQHKKSDTAESNVAQDNDKAHDIANTPGGDS